MLVNELKQLENSKNNINHEINNIINEQYNLYLNKIINIFKQDIKNKYYNNKYAIIQNKKIIQGTYKFDYNFRFNSILLFKCIHLVELNKRYVEREYDLCYIKDTPPSTDNQIHSYLRWKEPLLLNQSISSLFKKSKITISLSPFGKKLINDLKFFCKNEGIQITKIYACYCFYSDYSDAEDCDLNEIIQLKTTERPYYTLKLNYEIMF